MEFAGKPGGGDSKSGFRRRSAGDSSTQTRKISRRPQKNKRKIFFFCLFDGAKMKCVTCRCKSHQKKLEDECRRLLHRDLAAATRAHEHEHRHQAADFSSPVCVCLSPKKKHFFKDKIETQFANHAECSVAGIFYGEFIGASMLLRSGSCNDLQCVLGSVDFLPPFAWTAA